MKCVLVCLGVGVCECGVFLFKVWKWKQQISWAFPNRVGNWLCEIIVVTNNDLQTVPLDPRSPLEVVS